MDNRCDLSHLCPIEAPAMLLDTQLQTSLSTTSVSKHSQEHVKKYDQHSLPVCRALECPKNLERDKHLSTPLPESGVKNMISNNSEHFQKIQWPRMISNGRPAQKHCCLLQKPSGSQRLYSRNMWWDLWLHHAHQHSWALGTEEEGGLVTVWLKSTGILQRLCMVTKVNSLLGCGALGGWGTRTPRLWCSTRGSKIQGALLLPFGLHCSSILVPLVITTVSAPQPHWEGLIKSGVWQYPQQSLYI